MPGKTGMPFNDIPFTALASMRPQRNAGENKPLRTMMPKFNLCFNEAPAKCRGKQSMPGRGQGPDPSGFNEAPVKCRGKPMKAASLAPACSGFNEAPAKCRGKRVGNISFSMTSPGFNEAPAKCRGKQRRRGRCCTRWTCFNEAPAKCRGKLPVHHSRVIRFDGVLQ